MLKNYFIISFVFLSLISECHAGAFEEGGAAYKAGDYELAAKKFMEVADKNDHRAMYALGSMYAAGRGVQRDFTKAFELFRRAARYGRLDARYKLGIMYQEGLGIKKDNKRAARIFYSTANKGYGPAQFRLGMCYANGIGVQQDPVKAAAWLALADDTLQKRPLIVAADQILTGDEPESMQVVSPGIVKQELEKVVAELSPEQREAASKLVKEYMQ